ncbi:MAG: ABC transporter ATP-binding protein [bacterium]|nr:ABC transporter ATP-binding protein [bacterium]
MSGAPPIISLDKLVKRFGKVQALDGVTVDVPQGAVGLLGPNGAGKTTMIKLLLGLLVPTKGKANIAGFRPKKRSHRLAVRRVVGYMPEGDCLLPDMSAVELVSTLGRITGLTREDAMTRSHEVLDYVELEEARYRKLDQYSTGMKQRLKLAQALVHDPKILLLDEPTNGLDPKGRRHMLTLIDDLGRKQGKNVLLCSHLLHDVESTCDYVVVMNKGRVIQQGAVADMTGGDNLRLVVSYEGASEDFARALGDAGFRHESRGERELVIELETAVDDADDIFAAAAQARIAITSLDRVRSTLEEVFLKAVGEHESHGALAPTNGAPAKGGGFDDGSNNGAASA